MLLDGWLQTLYLGFLGWTARNPIRPSTASAPVFLVNLLRESFRLILFAYRGDSLLCKLCAFLFVDNWFGVVYANPYTYLFLDLYWSLPRLMDVLVWYGCQLWHILSNEFACG